MKLTPLQAYAAMQLFLEDYFQKTSSDSLGSLLGSMSFLEDGHTADPALWVDWTEAVNYQECLTALQAFVAMNLFLHNYYGDNYPSVTIKKIFTDTEVLPTGNLRNQSVWEWWMRCIELNPPIGMLKLQERE